MANETVELYYKGKPINPNRDLPTRTYAEAQAEGLTSGDKLWVRNDAPQSDLIVDNLTTDDSARALSAKQGKVLNDRLKPVEIVTTKVFFNQSSLVFDLGFTPSSSKSGTGILVNGNQGAFAILRLDATPTITKLNGSMNLSIAINDSEITITSSSTLWGATMVMYVTN